MYEIQGEHTQNTARHQEHPFPPLLTFEAEREVLQHHQTPLSAYKKGLGMLIPKLACGGPQTLPPLPCPPSCLPPPPPRQSPPHGSPALEPFRQLSRWRQLSEPLCQLSRYRQLLEPLRQLWRWARKWTSSWRWSHRCHWSHLVAGRRRVHRVSVA